MTLFQLLLTLAVLVGFSDDSGGKAQYMFDSGKYELAIEQCRKDSDRYSEDPAPYEIQFKAEMALGRYEDAARTLVRLLRTGKPETQYDAFIRSIADKETDILVSGLEYEYGIVPLSWFPYYMGIAFETAGRPSDAIRAFALSANKGNRYAAAEYEKLASSGNMDTESAGGERYFPSRYRIKVEKTGNGLLKAVFKQGRTKIDGYIDLSRKDSRAREQIERIMSGRLVLHDIRVCTDNTLQYPMILGRDAFGRFSRVEYDEKNGELLVFQPELKTIKRRRFLPADKPGIQNATFKSEGYGDFPSWVSSRLTYASGFIVVSFYVSKDGTVTDARIVRAPGTRSASEAIRIVSSSPKWTPATIDGKAVESFITLPINMNLR